jgi:hypothetical protein
MHGRIRVEEAAARWDGTTTEEEARAKGQVAAR